MKIGLVGYQRSGKSSLFHWLTGVASDPSLAHMTQTSMAGVRDERLASLCQIYQPKKGTPAALELVDTPGLSCAHEGNAARLALIREAGCLAVVVGRYDQSDPAVDLRSFEEDLLLADLEVISGRADRLRESIKKPRPNRDEQRAELVTIEPLIEILESGKPLRDHEMTEEQCKITRSYQLLTEKPRLAIVNIADDEQDAPKMDPLPSGDVRIVHVPVRLELELSQMNAEEQDEFRREMGLSEFDRDGLIRTLMDVSGQLVFFTAGAKEVRTWMIRQGATALEAADTVHSDMARGFIRAEVISCEDLVRLGSEREVKQQNLVRQEPKDYVVQDGDILNIRFNV